MALFHVIFRSKMLNHDTELNVIIPDNCNQEKIPVLWLLHGMHDNHSGWCRRTGIERYANAYKIAVVCPDGENSYYTNMVYGKRYFDFLTDELVAFVRKTFRLSDRREDNFICGLSMGGYGALHTALMRPDLYSAAASLSGVADIVSRLQVCAWTHEARMVWGDNFKENVKNCEADIMWLAENFPKDSEKPRIFSCCGTEDSLYENNITFRDFMLNTDFDYTYDEGPGVHNWDFWDTWVKKAIEWMMEGR